MAELCEDWRLIGIADDVDWDQLYDRFSGHPEELEAMVESKVEEVIQRVVHEIKDIAATNDELDARVRQRDETNKQHKTETITDTIYYDDKYTYYSDPIQRVIDIDELKQRMNKAVAISQPANETTDQLAAKTPDTTADKSTDQLVEKTIDKSADVTTVDTSGAPEESESKASEETQTDDNIEIMELSVIYEGTSAPKRDTKSGFKRFIRQQICNENRVFAASNGILTYAWKPAKVTKVLNMWNTSVVFDDRSVIGGNMLSNKLIAYSMQSNCGLEIGERVVAYLQEGNSGRELYSGTVAEPAKNTNNFRYLIFFDKHAYSYVKREDIYYIYDKSNVDAIFAEKDKEDYIEIKEFADFLMAYIRNYPERPMVRLQRGDDRIKVRFDRRWESGRVLEIDSSLALIEFYKLPKPHSEWIYRGSRRLYDIYKECQTSTSNVRHHGRSTTRVTRRSDNRPHVEWDNDEEKENEESEQPTAEDIDDDIIVVPKEEANRKRKFKQTARKSTAKPSGSVSSACDPMRLIDNELFTPSEVSVEQFPDVTRVIPRKYAQHMCSADCVNAEIETEDFYDKNPFHIPIIVGYRREIVRTNEKKTRIYYCAPCGRRLRSIHEVFNYLLITHSILDIDLFTFSTAFSLFRKSSPLRALFHIPDLTNGLERQPISCVNTVDQTDLGNVVYSEVRFPHPDVNFKIDPQFLSCCDCEDNCLNSNTCSCQQLTLEASDTVRMSKYQYFGYEYKRLDEFVMTGVFECNQNCRCNQRCPNRVVQLGIKCRLQLFKTLKKGWGVRVLHDVPRGTFLCIYAAQILNEEAADKEGRDFGDEYLADLDYIDVCEGQKEGYESDAEMSDEETTQDSDYDDDEDDEDDKDFKCTNPSTSEVMTRGRSTTSGGRRQKDDKSKNRYSIRKDFFNEDFCYTLDAKRRGNIGRYLNHSCEPNCFVQNVFVDSHDLRFPWVSFFAKKDILAYEELTWDYNYQIGSIPGRKMYCYCGAHRCKKRLL